MTVPKLASTFLLVTSLSLADIPGLVSPVGARNLAPYLDINRTTFCTGSLSNDWVITVTGATPSSDVVLEEFYYSGGWTISWGPGVIGTTDGAGNFAFATRPPDFSGDFYAQVTIDGQTSGPVLYLARSSYC